MTKPDKIDLTSTVIAQKESYPWHEKMILVPHEAIRRELLRAERAINVMDAVNNPWHAIIFEAWLSDFFFPAVHEHHYIEENILGPFYAALGEKPQFGKEYTHEVLLKQMEVILKSAAELAAAVKESAPSSSLIEQQSHLKGKFTEFNTYMLRHLAEEDAEWPATFLKYGEKSATDAEKKIIKYAMSLKGKDAIVSKAFFGSIADAMGLTPKKYQSILSGTVQLSPWCGEKDSKEFWSSKPFIPRVFLFPGWVKVYATKWKPMIDSIVANLEPGTVTHKNALRKTPVLW